MDAKNRLDMASDSDIDSPSTRDLVPMQDDQEERESKAKKRKKHRMSTLLRPLGAAPVSPQAGPSKPKGTFACNICEHSYTTMGSLKRHLNTHSWEKEYPCQYCDKVFALAEYKTKHELVHTGEKRYQCLLCNNTSGNYSALITHCRHFHNMHPSGRKQKKCMDDGNSVYRVLPCKTLKLQPRDNVPDIKEEGEDMVHIIPSIEHMADQGLQTPDASTRPRTHTQPGARAHTQPGARAHRPTQPGARAHTQPGARAHRPTQPGARAHRPTQPGAHADPPSPCGAEFEFIIPETY